MKVSPLAVEHLDLLHAIGHEVGGPAALAGELGRDASNVSKTVKRLREAGFVHPETLALSEMGAAVTRTLGPDGSLLAPGDLIALRHDQIELDPDNERETIDHAELSALRESILMHGLLQNPVVTAPETPGGAYRLVIGERRWLAIQAAIDDGDWPAERLITCRLSPPLSARDRAVARMSENLQRADLHPLDEGHGFQRLRDVHGLGTDEIADEIGRSRKHVQDRIALVEKTTPADQARMRLPKDDPAHLNYRDAREAMRESKPKPLIDVTPKEALVLLEVAARHADRPSSHPAHPGKDGWIELAQLPAGGAASSLVGKGYLDIIEPFGAHVFARVARRTDVETWLANRCVTGIGPALWNSRSEVLTAFEAGDLNRAGRYATDWLNAPAEPEERRPAALSPVTPRESGGPMHTDAPPVSMGRPDIPGDDVGKDPANPVREAEPPYVPALVPSQAAAMAEVCHAIEHHPIAGPSNAYEGARAFAFHGHESASALVITAKLLKFQPDAKRSGNLVCLSTLGEAWRDANRDLIDAVGDYATPWLKPPAADAAPAKPAGPLAPMLADTFAEQLRKAGEEDPETEDLSLAEQIAWVETMKAVINSVHRPILGAIKRSLETLRDA